MVGWMTGGLIAGNIGPVTLQFPHDVLYTASVSKGNKLLTGLTFNTYLLAFASFFSDVSTEMLYPVLPVFLTQVLGADTGVLGLIEGIAPALQNIIQGFSGWLSDKFQRRKPIALAGYVLAAVAKPLIGLSQGWSGVLVARSLDRLGAGSRSAPRDALIAASAEPKYRGKAFGLEGIGDNLGAFVGPLIAIALLSFFQTELRSIFLLAVIPGLISTALVLFVKERPVALAPKMVLDATVVRFPREYWLYLIATALFGIGNSTNAFLILRTQNLGVSLTVTILIYAFYNLVAALASYPAGTFSDRFGRKRLLLFAILVFFLVYVGFGMSTNVYLLGFLFILYGLYQGIFRAVGKAMATDFVPSEWHGSAVGWYTATIGITGLVASVLGGVMWSRWSPSVTFLYGAASAVLGGVALIVLVADKKHRA